MRERDLAGLRNGTAADKAGLRDSVMRRLERALDNEPCLTREPSDGVDLCYLEGLFKLERREDRREPLREHCLAGTRRADEKDVVTARARNL